MCTAHTYTHTDTHLQFATWGMGGCWKLFKLNRHRSEWAQERGERNPDEFIITAFENMHTRAWECVCAHTHKYARPHTHTHSWTAMQHTHARAHTHMQRHVQRRWLSRARIRSVLRPYRQRCPAFNRPSYSLSRLSLSRLLVLSLRLLPSLPPFRKAKCEKHARLQTLI